MEQPADTQRNRIWRADAATAADDGAAVSESPKRIRGLEASPSPKSSAGRSSRSSGPLGRASRPPLTGPLMLASSPSNKHSAIAPGSEDCLNDILKKAFNVYDTDNNGCIDHDELRTLMHDLGWDNDPEVCDRLLQELDEDMNGEISFEEFTRWRVVAFASRVLYPQDVRGIMGRTCSPLCKRNDCDSCRKKAIDDEVAALVAEFSISTEEDEEEIDKQAGSSKSFKGREPLQVVDEERAQ